MTSVRRRKVKMKRVFFLGVFFLAMVLPVLCLADWSVTATWTRSVGPGLDYEECQLDGAVKCTVQETEATTCTFVVSTLSGQEVKIRSYNSQGGYADYVIGTLMATPAPATGGSLTIVYVP